MSAPPLVIGAGPAGAAAACLLAEAGASPLVLEKTREDGDPLCGGFLSWRTLERLARLGLDRDTLGGTAIDHVAIFAGTQVRRARLPGPGMGLSRRRLDRLLRARAEAAGVVIRRSVAARGMEDGVVSLSGGEMLRPSTLFLATGKRDLRGLNRPERHAADPEIGLRLRLPPHAARTRMIGPAIELHLFDGGYLGLLVQEDGSANACMAVRKRLLTRADGDVRALVAGLAVRSPVLAERLGGLDRASVDAVGPVPYGWIAHAAPPGIFRLGDQAAVIPSLAGEGIDIALASAERAVAVWRREGAGGAGGYQRRFGAAARRPVALAGVMRTLAGRVPGLAMLVTGVPGVLPLVARLTRV